MDHFKQPVHGKIYKHLGDEQTKPLSPNQVISSLSLWDSPESDTESLAQERAYQQALQRRIGFDKGVNKSPHLDHKTDCFTAEGDGREEDEEHEDLSVYDSLETTAHKLDNMNHSLSSKVPNNFKILDDTTKYVSRQVPCDDTYSDLRYDPNWRSNLNEGGRFDQSSPQLSLKDVHQMVEEKSEASHRKRQELSIKGGYRYVASPVLAQASDTTKMHPLMSYHLHGQMSNIAGDGSLTSSFQSYLPENQISDGRSFVVSSEKSMDRTLRGGLQVPQGQMNQAHLVTIRSPSPKHEGQYRVVHDIHDKEFESYYERGQRLTRVTATLNQSKSPSTFTPRGVRLSNKKQEKSKEDIVERNKMTLGINAAKPGSYLKVHSEKVETPDTWTQVSTTPEKVTIPESRELSLEDNTDPELKWQKKTQQLKLTQITKEKKAQRNWKPISSRDKRGPAPGVNARVADCLSPPSEGLATRTQPNLHPQPSPMVHADTYHSSSALGDSLSQRRAQRLPSNQPPFPNAQPPSPIVHLSISLNTSPFWHEKVQDTVSTLTNLLDPQRQNRSDVHVLNLSSPCYVPPHTPRDSWESLALGPLAAASPAPSDRVSGQEHQERAYTLQCPGRDPKAQLQQWHHTPDRWQRQIAPQWQSPPVEYLNRSSNVQLLEDSSRPPFYTAQTEQSRSHTLLPPIGESMTGAPDLVTVRTTERISPMQRSSSDGYLGQLEKQKLLKERVTYKAYTLKDYKRLKQDVCLGGLGPDYTTNEITAEKLRRQRLYSNVIREQNKKISRIPFLPAIKPEHSDRRDMVPRMKALEYAKSISRPKMSSQTKTRETQRSEGLTENAGYLDSLDLSNMTMLELLRKRHEEEKQAVSHFKLVHVV